MFRKIFIFALVAVSISVIIAQSDFKANCLKFHNKWRKVHGVPDLVFDQTVHEVALQWARYLAKNAKFEHRPDNSYGENIYMKTGGSATAYARDAVKAWYDEIDLYDYNNPGFSMETGHFTQVVWKGSKKLGCAFAKNGTKVYVVANYDPPGNYANQFPANVPKPVK